MPAPQRIVFIASLGHSGSTLLDLVLGGHPRFIGLGEIGSVVGAGADRTRDPRAGLCSCGRGGGDCPFWSVVIDRLAAEPEATTARRYALVLETFTAVFGPDAVPVDSSKYLGWLRLVHRELGLEPEVLFLLKDVRAFAVSKLDNVPRKRAAGRARTHVTSLGAFREWYAHNRRLQRYLEQERLPALRIGYEGLCLAPEATARRICGFLGVDYHPGMLALGGSRSHVLRGNRMRGAHDGTIRYDHRWFRRGEWLLPAVLCRRIMRYNREQVYGGRDGEP